MSLPIIPGYEVTELIGRGGMGRVYRAVDRQLGRTVAIKLLVDSEDPELVSRFESEASAVASLSHPNIAQLFEFAKTESGQPYFVMEHVGGGTLADVISGRPVHQRRAAEILATLARAIQAAHQQGILHRDLKPANILIHGASRGVPQAESRSTVRVGSASATDTDPQVETQHASRESSPKEFAPDRLKIADFGLARRIEADNHLTRSGQLVGTPAYMAPEQASGIVKRPGPGVDIYSLGAILFELLTGRPPFLGTDSTETIMLLLTEEPPNPRSLQRTISRDLETICLKCLEKKPSRRYLSAADLADDLTRFLEGRPILAKPVSRFEHLLKWAARNPWKATAMTLFTISGLAAMIGVAALRAAYRDVMQANGDLSRTNEQLITANEQITASRDLAKEALDRVVNRLRESLYDVPQATPLMMETSRESVDLHRRLYRMQPEDLDLSRRYVDALYNHSLLESVHGDKAQSITMSSELETALADVLTKHPDDLKLKITRVKVLLGNNQTAGKRQVNSEQLDLVRGEIRRGMEELLRDHADSAEVMKLGSLVATQDMDAAMQAGDLKAYVAAARERVKFSRQYLQAENNTPQKSTASLWLAQSERVLAQGLMIVNETAEAEAILKEATTQLAASFQDVKSRAFHYEQAQLSLEMARVQEKRGAAVKAIKGYADAQSTLLHLVQDYPDDVAYRSRLAESLIRSAALVFGEGNSKLALEQLSVAESQVDKVLSLSPGDAEAQTMKTAIPRFRNQIATSISPPEKLP